MRKFILSFVVFTTLASCKTQGDQDITSDQTAQEFSFRNMPKDVELVAEAQLVLEDWEEYRNLEDSFSVLKRATNTEDLKLAIDDLLEKEAALAKGEYPAPFDQLQIKSRQQVVRTFILKIKGNLEDRQGVQEAMAQMLEAYNAMKQQFNILTSNTLDKELIDAE